MAAILCGVLFAALAFAAPASADRRHGAHGRGATAAQYEHAHQHGHRHQQAHGPDRHPAAAASHGRAVGHHRPAAGKPAKAHRSGAGSPSRPKPPARHSGDTSNERHLTSVPPARTVTVRTVPVRSGPARAAARPVVVTIGARPLNAAPAAPRAHPAGTATVRPSPETVADGGPQLPAPVQQVVNHLTGWSPLHGPLGVLLGGLLAIAVVMIGSALVLGRRRA